MNNLEKENSKIKDQNYKTSNIFNYELEYYKLLDQNKSLQNEISILQLELDELDSKNIEVYLDKENKILESNK